MGERHLSAVPVTRPQISASAARQLTDNIRVDVDRLWLRLLDAYERGAHTALGYTSWAEYMKAEFGTKSSRAYQMLDAGRVARAIEGHSTNVERPRRESAARELAPLLKEEGEEAVGSAWAQAIETYGNEPTSAEVRVVVGKRKEPTLTKEQQKFANALNALEFHSNYIATAMAGRTVDEQAALAVLLDVDENTLAEWARQTRVIDRVAYRLRVRFIRRQS